MKKIITVIVILAVIWAIPPARGWVSTAALPVLEKLGPVGAWVLNPTRRLAARTKITFLLRQIAVAYNEGHQPPQEGAFHVWMKERLPQETGLDPWGNRFWYRRADTIITIGSSGPDGKRGTEDDVSKSAPF